jgi:hypothetical protein
MSNANIPLYLDQDAWDFIAMTETKLNNYPSIENLSACANLISAIFVATRNHHATIAVQPGENSYSVTVMLLGYERNIDCSDLNQAIVEASDFIAETLAMVDG